VRGVIHDPEPFNVTATSRDEGILNTDPRNWTDINVVGFHAGPASWIFGTGPNYTVMGEYKPLTSTVIDATTVRSSSAVLNTTREVASTGPVSFNITYGFPVSSPMVQLSNQLSAGVLSTAGPETTRIAMNLASTTLGIDSNTARFYAGSYPLSTTAETVDSSSLGDATIVVSSATVAQGAKLNVSSVFVPRVSGASYSVSVKLVATDSSNKSYTITETGVINASVSNPAGVVSDVRTDVFALGRLSMAAIYTDTNSRVVAVAVEHLTIVQPYSETKYDVISTYGEVKRNDISQGLRNLTQVGIGYTNVLLKEKGERSLIVVASDTLPAVTDVSLVVTSRVIEPAAKGMHVSVYDLATSSEGTLVGTGVTVPGTAVKKYGTNLLTTTSPVLVNGQAVYADEHIVGALPLSTANSAMLFNINMLGSVGFQENNFRLYLHKALQLRAVSRTSISRSGGTVDLVYSVPFAHEEIRLLVIGYTSTSIPSTISWVSSTSSINGSVSFIGVEATKEHFISLYNYPFRVGRPEDLILTEKLDA
jgi:hypothetical protein